MPTVHKEFKLADLLDQAMAAAETRFTEDELSSAYVALCGLERVHAKLLARCNRADADQLAEAIQRTKRVFRGPTEE